MDIRKEIELAALKIANALYGTELDSMPVQRTRKEFEGDYTLVVFPFTKAARKAPPIIANEIGEKLVSELEVVESYNAVQGFLNLKLKSAFWLMKLSEFEQHDDVIVRGTEYPQRIMVEYSSPNTNKPLHLGHIRNNLLGWSLSEIFKAKGNTVIKANLINDRGIHICKSMLAWLKFGNGETPESSGLKGDALVGKYYVEFEKHLIEDAKLIIEDYWNNLDFENFQNVQFPNTEPLALIFKDQEFDDVVMMFNKYFERITNGNPTETKVILLTEILEDKKLISAFKPHSFLNEETREMLLKWEAGDPEVLALWNKMNGWVYEGHNATYAQLGVDFDQFYYESNTYKLGKDLVQEGLDKGVFFKKDDGSVWIDLTENGLDEKILLRSDGTSVYMTQDVGTADLKYQDYKTDRSIYVVGNEQEYHFKVLKLIAQKLGKPYADGIYHFSYGMIDLPEGKMKSREGTVVDADDLMDLMIDTAKIQTEELGKIDMLSEEDREQLYHMLGMGALKYFLLKTDPRRRIVFNPKESIDFQGNTGPFIQYTHSRIRSIERKAALNEMQDVSAYEGELAEAEHDLLFLLNDKDTIIDDASDNMSPAVIANYCYEVAKSYNSFYHECPILKEEDPSRKKLRLTINTETGKTLRYFMGLLGIELPDRM